MKILLVDDEAPIRRIGRLSLETVGRFEVVVATNASEALALAAAERPDLVLLDVMMPGMDGVATLAELKKSPELATIPVVFMTARVQRHEIERYVQLGALGVIQKPFDPMTLPDEVRRLLVTSA